MFRPTGKIFAGILLLLAFSTEVATSKTSALNVVDLLQKLIAIDTVNPPGNEIRAARFVKNYLDGFQIPSEIIESAPGRGNLIARLKGDGSKKPIALLGHLDVVPADSAEWNYPPLRATLEGDHLYGRGAMDMKGMVAMEIAALVKLKLENVLLKRDVLLILTADEEAGGKFGAEFLVEKHWDKIASEFIFSEGSIGLRQEGLHLYPIQVAEKGVAWMKVTARGTSGHGSMPLKPNAVAELTEAIHRISAHPQPIQRTAIVEELLKRMADRFSFPISFMLRHFFTWPVSSLATSMERTKFLPEKIFNALLRNTVVPTMLQAGSKVNVIPATAAAMLDGRVLPGETPEGFRKKMENLIHNPSIQVELVMQSQPNESEFRTNYFEILEKVILKNNSEAVVVPYLSPGATDNRFFRAKGVISYGLIPILITLEDLDGLHGKNERIPISELARGEKIIYDLVLELQ